MATKIQYTTTIISPSGGINGTAGQGMQYAFTLSLTSGVAEVTLILTNNETGVQSQFGFGNANRDSDPEFSHLLVNGNKVYLLAGPSVEYFSALNDPTTWNDPNGILLNGFRGLCRTYYATQSPLTSMAAFSR